MTDVYAHSSANASRFRAKTDRSCRRRAGAIDSLWSAIVEAVRGLGLEGVVAKRKDSLYEPGERSDAWQKLKLENQQEFVIGGYRPASGGVDALLIGYYDDAGLRFAGRVRAGFVPHLRREVFEALKPHHVDVCPFVDLPNPKSSRWGGGVTPDEMREMQWVRPERVAQIRYVEWTADFLRTISNLDDGRLRVVDYRCALNDKALTISVKRQQGLLINRLDRHKPHGGPGHRLADRLRIVAIVLAALAIRRHKGWSHQPYRMPQRLEPTRPFMGTCALLLVAGSQQLSYFVPPVTISASTG